MDWSNPNSIKLQFICTLPFGTYASQRRRKVKIYGGPEGNDRGSFDKIDFPSTTTVKLGDKERFEIGVKEPFPVTN